VRDLDWSDVVADGERMTDQQQFLMELDRHDNALAESVFLTLECGLFDR